MKKFSRRKPKFMMIYLCPHCGMDSALSDREAPHCFYCGSKKNLILITRKKITPHVIANRLKRVADRLMENLQGAYFAGKKNREKFDEAEFLQIMAKAKKLTERVKTLRLKS